MSSPLLVFNTEKYAELGQRVCDHGGFELGELERKVFPDGELYRRLVTDVGKRDVVLLGGTITDIDTLELYDIACGLVHAGVHTLTLVLPWFGYQTMERASKPGEIVAAKTRSRLLSSIPTAGSGNRAVMLDLHSEGITQYFCGNIRPVHLQARSVVLDAIRDLAEDQPFVLGATDAGRAKWVESLANALDVEAAFVFKRRVSGKKTEVTALAADVTDKRVIMYDDMIRTGGSLIAAAQAYLDSGAKDVAAVTTHAVLAGDALDKIRSSKALAALVGTDTRPHAEALADGDFFRVVTVSGLIADFLHRSV